MEAKLGSSDASQSGYAAWLPIISGKRRGLDAAAWRGALWSLSWAYRGGFYLKNRKFAAPSAVKQVPVPVISVGNLTTGGTGKTPFVKWLCRMIRDHKQLRVALLSRGYGRAAAGLNDEALELERTLPDVPHLQDPDRGRSAQIAIEELESECLVLDDGFQHRQLGRNLDIVLIDATCPFGFNFCLPRGLLREPLSGLRRADAIVITRSDLVPPARVAEICGVVRQYLAGPNVPIACAVHRPKHLVDCQGQTLPLESLAGQPVLVIAGIGNPDAFFQSLQNLNATVLDRQIFADHYNYTRAEIESLKTWVRHHCPVDSKSGNSVPSLPQTNTATNTATTDKRASDGRASDGRPSDSEPSDSEPSHGEPSQSEPQAAGIGQQAASVGRPRPLVITTCKDLVKLEISQLANCRVLALEVEFEFVSGQAEIESLVRSILPDAPGIADPV